MIEIINFFANILSYIISPIYSFVENYGLAVILFTIIVKIVLVPLGIKQQKTTVKTKMIKPELEKIQAKYKNDKNKLNEETMKLYQKYGVNPMGGCLPLLIQLPILLGLYRIIQAPITWFLRKTPDVYIGEEIEKGNFIKDVVMEKIASIGEKVDFTKFESVKDLLDHLTINEKIRDLEIKVASELDIIDFNFLGLDLSKTPSVKEPGMLWLIPILATGSAFFSNWVSQKINPMSPEQAQQMKTMNMMMPLMTAFFTFTLPAGIGLYWFISTIVSVLQMVLLTKYFEKKYVNTNFVSEKKEKGKK